MPKQPDPAPDLLLTEEPLCTDSPPSAARHGASVQFLGVVRDLDGGRPIWKNVVFAGPHAGAAATSVASSDERPHSL